MLVTDQETDRQINKHRVLYIIGGDKCSC